MKWHDGTAVTSRRRGVQPGKRPGGGKAPMFSPFVQTNVANIETIGPMSLRITLKRPDAAFLVSSLSKLNLAPKHIWAPILEELKSKPETAESIMEPLPRWVPAQLRFVSVKLNEQDWCS